MVYNEGEDMRVKSEEKGFTLLELIISMAIFSIGIMAVASMHGMSINANAKAKKHTEATTVASDKLEKFRAMGYDDPAFDADSNPHEEVIDGKYTLTWSVERIDLDDPDTEPPPGDDDAKRITLNVTWQDRGQTKRFEPGFEFVKSRNVKF
ncbi:prepilin-type N-terminal cleavage/methylation domain-containing protein [Desulfobacterales bacterium HSG2]|nr:prepilin-type N-terminal cleavage/methylation domain-containing protein [Desulfobacterales bacterium HSG2]